MATGTWKASRIDAEAANRIQVDAGVFLKDYDVTNPARFLDSDILCTTTGDPAINCVPTFADFFEDVNGVQNNTWQGKRITGWDCNMSVQSLDFDNSRLKFYLGASKVLADGGIKPKMLLDQTDFKTIYFLGDMADPTKLFVVKMDNAMNTAGLAFSATKNGKGKQSLTVTAHADASDPEDVPMTFYILEKVDADAPTYIYTAVSPVGTENPKEEGWYVLVGDMYMLTRDTEVDENVTYYERSTET